MSMDSDTPAFGAAFRCWLPRRHEGIIRSHLGAFTFVLYTEEVVPNRPDRPATP